MREKGGGKFTGPVSMKRQQSFILVQFYHGDHQVFLSADFRVFSSTCPIYVECVLNI